MKNLLLLNPGKKEREGKNVKFSPPYKKSMGTSIPEVIKKRGRPCKVTSEKGNAYNKT